MPPGSFNGNGHRSSKLIDDHPELPELIQGLISDGEKQKDMPGILQEKHGITASLRSVERVIKDYSLKTSRHSGLTELEQTSAILTITEQDPLGRWGSRKVQEKLVLRGVHVPRDFITDVLKTANPEANAMRTPGAEKVHKKGLHSSGPNEEWCMDGHEKLLECMGIAVYGINDKFSRRELSLYALRSARKASVPPPLYLMLVKEKGGIPIQTTCDMGSETGILAALQTSLRQSFSALDLNQVPAHVSTKSIFNITRERAWRPCGRRTWRTSSSSMNLENSVCVTTLQIHNQDFAVYVWGKAVQHRLDEHKRENDYHRVRRQKNSCLPTGGRHKDFYEQPHKWGGIDQLIPVDMQLVDRLIDEHTPADLFQFASSAMMEAVCEVAYNTIGAPEVSSHNAWHVFAAMINSLAPTAA
ncbi:hypothetical protein C8F01DRAFT_1369564 [Mycena amicta]|nr:hypothetical protein C8F01DRAFT_1369564 [Mycena amicta]